MQLGFSSYVTPVKVTSTNLIKGFGFCSEFKSGRQKSGGSPNEVDMSLVKSELIYFHKERRWLHIN